MRKIYYSIIIISSVLFLLVILYPFYIQKISLEIYLKDYSALILIYLTYIYVVLTYLILNSSNRLAKEQLRPYVIANLIEENNEVYFSVKNFGIRPAFDININVSDGFEEFQNEGLKGNYKYMLTQKFLAPAQEIKNYFTDPAHIVHPKRKNINKCFQFKVSFFDGDRKKYEMNYQIDLNNHYFEKGIKKDSVIDCLKELKKEIKNLSESITNFIRVKN